eukprot:3644597-Pyramimonas_sp.AAC.1
MCTQKNALYRIPVAKNRKKLNAAVAAPSAARRAHQPQMTAGESAPRIQGDAREGEEHSWAGMQ